MSIGKEVIHTIELKIYLPNQVIFFQPEKNRERSQNDVLFLILNRDFLLIPIKDRETFSNVIRIN